jgi:hypothetical protein
MPFILTGKTTSVPNAEHPMLTKLLMLAALQAASNVSEEAVLRFPNA